MTLKYLILGGSALLLGFLFYPRGGVVSVVDQEFIKPVRILNNEPLRYHGYLRADPIVTTYDLGFVYKIDKAEILFENADESGPKQYDILAHTDRTKHQFDRVFSYKGSSREYTYTLQALSFPAEARWLQVVINDWFSNKPELKKDEFRVGLRYQSHSPILAIHANYNSAGLQKLTDLLTFEGSKWVAAQRIVKEVKGENGEKKTENSYKAPADAIRVTGDLGAVRKIYGVRLTTDGPSNNLKQYHFAVSEKGQRYTEVYVSDTLADETVTDLYRFEQPVSGRYVRLRIDRGDWYGDYPEIREFEVFTDDYRLTFPADHKLGDYNAVQMYYENLGEADNAFAPYLAEGFAFDRGTGDENRFFLPEGDKEHQVDPDNTPSQKSFAYHYDTVKIKYTGLNPSHLHWVQVTYLQEKNGKRIQNLDVDGFLLHGAMELPQGKAESYSYVIPNEVYTDGQIVLNFNRLWGPNAAVSEVSILVADPTGGVDLAPVQPAKPNRRTIGRAVRISKKIVIDGKVDEWPLLYPMLPTNYDHPVKSPVALYTQWDDDNLYIAAIINQQAQGLEKNRRGRKSGGNETLHLFVDATLKRSPGMYTASDHHFVFTIFNSQRSQLQVHPSQTHHHLDAIPKNINYRKGIETQVSKTESVYILEARIPKDTVLNTFQPAIGRSIGLNYIMANVKLANNKSGWFAYASDDLNASPNRWNTVELVNQISGQVAFRDERATQPITAFNAGDVLTLCVWDAERNTDRHQPEFIEVELRNESRNQLITVILHESDFATLGDDNPGVDLATNSSLFAAKIPTVYDGNEEMNEEMGEGADDSPIRKFADSRIFVRGLDTVSLTYVDPYYSSTQPAHLVTTAVTVNTGVTGAIAITTASGKSIEQFQLGETIYIQVEDSDLLLPKDARRPEDDSGVLNPVITVNVVVPETEEVEPVELTFQPEQRHQFGSLATAYSETPTPNNGVLQAIGAQIVVAVYADQVQATGETNVPVSTQARVKIGDTARIELSKTPGLLLVNGMKFFKAGTSLTVLLHDTDLNHDTTRREIIDVNLNGNQLADQYQLMLKETTIASGEFMGTCTTQYATSADTSNDVLEIKGKEVVVISYIDALQGSGKTHITVTDTAEVRSGRDGTLEIIRVEAGLKPTPVIADTVTDLENFNAGDRLYFRLYDEDIVDKSIEITLIGETLNDHETVPLFQSVGDVTRAYPVTGLFFGSIGTAYSAERQEDDEILQVQGREQVRAVYRDDLTSTGETDVEVYDVCVGNIGTTGSLKVYNQMDFDYASDENVELLRFKAGDTLILEIRDADLSTTNAVAQLFETDFTENTVRDNIRVTMVEVTGNAGIFRGELETSYGETSIPNDDILQVQGAGSVTFTYIDALQDTGATQVPIQVQLSVETGNRGKIEVYSTESGKIISGFSVGIGSFNAGENLRIQLQDKDLNIDPTAIETAEVAVFGNVIADEARAILHETSSNSTVFEGDLQTQKGDAVNQQRDVPTARKKLKEAGSSITSDDILQVTDKEVITVVYTDEITTTGETAVQIQTQAIVLGSSAGLLRIVDANAISAGFVADHELGSFNAGETIYFWLEDLLLSTVVEANEVKIIVAGDKTKDQVTVILSKQLETEGIFVGSVPTRYGMTPVADKTLDVQGGEEIRATYTSDFSAVNESIVEDYAYTNKGSLGYLVISRKDGTPVRYFNVGTTLYFRMEDADLNLDPFVVESTDIQITTQAQGVVVTLHEESTNSRIFRGEISTQHGRTIIDSSAERSYPYEGQVGGGTKPFPSRSTSHISLRLVGGETVAAIYEDTLIDTGATNVEIITNCRANLIAWASYTSNPVLIDGLEDSWPLEKVLKTPQDEGLLWLQWDKDHLYLLAQIYDENIVVPDVLEYYHSADALEVHIDLQPDAVKKPSYLQTESNPNRYVLWFCPKGGGFNGDQPYIGQGTPEFEPNYQAANLDIAVRQRSSYYMIEVRIPFASVLRGFDPLKTKRHNRIGFNFVIHRSDDQAVYWAEQMPEAGPVFPSDLGLLILESFVP